MTNTKAIKELERQKVMFCHNCVHPQMVGWCENHCQIPEAYDMAINALKAQEKSQEFSNNSPEVDKENGELISRQQAIDAVEESRRLNHHQDGKEACAHEYEHRHFLKLLRDLPPSPSRPQWISCSERLPEHSCQTLVTTKWDTEYSVECGFYWGENRWGTITNNVIAWMPLPEPYQSK